MSNSRTFSGVTLEILNRMKALGRAERHRLRPPKAPLSTATRQTPFGERVIEFVHDPAKVELTLTLVKKPWLLPAESVLWNGFSQTLDRCRERLPATSV